ncbi:hypothetical protein SPDO_04390 [Sphingomonas dokdonensis]|uniref:Uncharacterized protein n=2 Tax=Sphingomonas dokdonensis TaxID=344880 RepID=A0A245ZUZ0_9SPHN|nr:hypothetical protein SPDO_04390 [Sphingomonas dokdonensis]
MLAPAFLMVGCTTPAAYPSLLPRAAESQALTEPAPAAPTPPAADPALDATLADIQRTLAEQTAAFDAASGRAEAAVAAARGAPAGSETWLDAHVALAALDALRAATSELATRVDDLASERALALQPDYSALDTMADRVRVEVQRQAEQIAALQGRLAPA